MNIRCLIVEDEIAGQTILSKKLNTFYPECQIIAIVDSKEKAIDFLTNNTVDLVFLDVQLKGGTGIGVLKSVVPNFETIFITAFREYAIDAINMGVSYYLLKPIVDEEFKKGVNQVIEKIKNKKVTTILIPHKNTQIPVYVNDIIYLKSEGAYTYIVTKDEQLLSSKNIGYYEQLFIGMDFVRTHHSFLVNIKHISKLMKGRSGQLIMSNDDEVLVSQRKMTDLLTILNVF